MNKMNFIHWLKKELKVPGVPKYTKNFYSRKYEKYKQDLRKYAAKDIGCSEDDLIWSEKCRNPLNNYHHPDGTIKGSEGYWVLK